ncbi:MAG: GH25 family lysozyme [Bacteroidales bacterium]|jgi:lysozyme|nr:GH25 family lysozyme [Bacteroidales bacterium]
MKRILQIIGILTLVYGCSGEQTDFTLPKRDTLVKKRMVDNRKNYVIGIDVSHYQGEIDWEKVSSKGIDFAYIKATEGITIKDARCITNYIDAKKQGINTGMYHFFIPDDDPTKQVENFLGVIHSLNPGDLYPVLDLEQEFVNNQISNRDYQRNVLLWLTTVENKLGVKPIIYSNYSFAKVNLSDHRFSDYRLWISEYDVDKPELPLIWEDSSWTLWQITDKGSVRGIDGNVDISIFNTIDYSFSEIVY